jgi:hypothetical protein
VPSVSQGIRARKDGAGRWAMKRVAMRTKHKKFIRDRIVDSDLTYKDLVESIIADQIVKIRMNPDVYTLYAAELERKRALSVDDGVAWVWVDDDIKALVEEARDLIGIDTDRKTMDVMIYDYRSES